MNPLQEHPHLFANGRFSVRSTSVYDEAGYDFDVIGYTYFFDPCFCVSDRAVETVSVESCTLIARPIENMKDGEILKVMPDEQYTGNMEMTIDERKRLLSDLCQSTDGSGVPILYLLSIGVYPFDQSHFDDGTVIDINDV